MALLGAIIIGLSLGLFGSGGSILTVPVLLYMVGQEPKLAIASSLLVVAGISFMASLPNLRKAIISWRHVLFFGVPGMFGTYGGAWLGGMVESWVQLFVFAGLMLVAAVFMWRKRAITELPPLAWRPWKVLAEGTIVGVITGFVGVGGGFLIVPALVILGGLALPVAVASSLVIISLKSFVGFGKYYQVLVLEGYRFDWQVIGLMVMAGFIGSILGGWLGSRIPAKPLQRGFAIFLVIMAIYVVIRTI